MEYILYDDCGGEYWRTETLNDMMAFIEDDTAEGADLTDYMLYELTYIKTL